jgi:hypothetical protein
MFARDNRRRTDNSTPRSDAIEVDPRKPRMKTEWMFVLPVAVFVILLVAPDDVLDQWAWARAYNDFALRAFPFMKRYAPHSPFVQVIQLGASLFITLIWLQSLIFVAVVLPHVRVGMLRTVKMYDDRWAKPIFISLSCVLMTLFSFAVRNGPDVAKQQVRIDMTRFTTAFLESGVLIFLPASLAMLLFSLYGLLTRSSRRT